MHFQIFFLLSLLYQSLGERVIRDTQCNTISCQNDGTFDPITCKCRCLTGFSGYDCSAGPGCNSLPEDPTICRQYFCTDNDLKDFCPKTCQCRNSASTNSPELCSKISCRNNGIFDPASCKCKCLFGFSGNDCSIGPDCGSLPNDPKDCNDAFCYDKDLKALCPKTCQCKNSPLLTTNFQKLCNKISCQNNGIFDPALCKCICLVGYSGSDCSVSSNCGSLPEDPKICLKDFCSDRDLRVLCPKTCKC